MTTSAALLETYTREAFRLETLPLYHVPGNDGDFQTFVRDGRLEQRPELLAYIADTRDKVNHGARHVRCRVLDDPLSPYEQYEILTWQKGGFEDIARICFIDRPVFDCVAAAHGLPPATDFWLFDESAVAFMQYTADTCTFTGSTVVTDSATVARCIAWRDAVLAQTYGWAEALARHAGALSGPAQPPARG